MEHSTAVSTQDRTACSAFGTSPEAKSESWVPATRPRSYSLRSPNRERRAASPHASASTGALTQQTLNAPTAMVGVGTRTARFGERSEYEGSRVPASTIAVHKDSQPQTSSEAGFRTARFGKRSEYEGSRVPASTIAVHEDSQPQTSSEAGFRTTRFGERSEYEGSRVPASTIAVHAETCANAA